MRLAERWRSADRPTISFELFPPRTDKAARKLPKVIDKLAAAKPDFFSVTFGAGGSTIEGSRELVSQLRQRSFDVLAYFAGWGLGPETIGATLAAYRDLGVDNLLVVRGDKPEQQIEPHPDALPHASDLLAFIRPRFDGFCLGAAGYPEGHVEAESLDRDIDFVELKVRQGAEFIIANYCYDNTYFFDFLQRCRDRGIEVPIVPGVMPVYTVKMTENLAKLCGATLTDALRDGIAALPEGDKDALTQFGIDFATEQCRGLLRGGVPGVHIYTMDRSKTAVAVVERLRAEGLL